MNPNRRLLALLCAATLGSVWACSSSPGHQTGGTGGEEDTGGVSGGDTGGKPGGTGGKGTGGSTPTGGSGGGAGGSAGGSGGEGGSAGGAGGTAGGGGGNGGGGSGGNAGGAGGNAGGSGGNAGGAGGAGGASGPFKLSVTGATMANGKLYFKKGQTRDSGHMSPAMEWTPVAGAMSYAVSMVDTDNGNTHWVIYDIPPTVTKLPDNLMRGMQMAPEIPGAKHTRFSASNPYGYFGPGADCRTYNFMAYALKVATLPGVAAASPSALRTGALASAANVLEKTANVGVIGQASGNMCP